MWKGFFCCYLLLFAHFHFLAVCFIDQKKAIIERLTDRQLEM